MLAASFDAFIGAFIHRHAPRPRAAAMIPTAREKAEWRRVAQAAYRTGRHVTGHRFAIAADLPTDTAIPAARFNALQADYYAWLAEGFTDQRR